MRNILLCLASLLVVCGNPVALAKGDFAQLTSWVGRYPSDSLDPKTLQRRKPKITFFALPQIKQRLRRLLSSSDYTLLTRDYGVEVPIERHDNFVVAHVCRP
ncbi:MAG TPA: hypothetical protein V6C72_00605, partial [Chroococcales cyanobacterium]